MSLEKVSQFIGKNYGCKLDDLKNNGINYTFKDGKLDITDFENKISKQIDDIYNEWESQKEEAKNILKVIDEPNSELKDNRTKIHDKAIEKSKEFAKNDAIKTIYGNTFLSEGFDRSAFSFVINFAKDKNEIQEIANSIKNKDTQKLTTFFKNGLERSKEAVKLSLKSNNEENILDNAIRFNNEYKVLAEMQPGKIEGIAKALGIENEVKKEVNNWLNDFAPICVTASLQRNYLNLFSSPLYPDMGLEPMFKNIDINEVTTLEEYETFVDKHTLMEDTIKTFCSEKAPFKTAYGELSAENAQYEYENIFNYLKNENKKEKENVILDDKGNEIKNDEIGAYMASGKKIFVYDDTGKYLSSMKANPINFGTFSYNYKDIDINNEENMKKGFNELKNELSKNNPWILNDPKKDYSILINKIDDLTKNNLNKDQLKTALADINELASKYMTEHKKAKGITGFGEKRRNAVENVFNSCKKILDDMEIKKEKNIENRRTISAPEANAALEQLGPDLSINEVTKKIARDRSKTENDLARMMRENAQKKGKVQEEDVAVR